MAGQWLRLASARSSRMCPSTMPRTSSAMGSSMSPPATSTVYSAVIDPFAELPVRSRSLGRELNTLGG